MSERIVIVAGGSRDPNVRCILNRLSEQDIKSLALPTDDPDYSLTWDLNNDCLRVAGTEIFPDAVFLRYDVFTFLCTGRQESRRHAARWYHTMLSWILAHDQASFLNRSYGTRQISKPYLLIQAQRSGLRIPRTMVSNSYPWVTPDCRLSDNSEPGEWIVKPVDGGEYTRVLTEAMMDAPWGSRNGIFPSIIQKRLHSPDLRIYRIGNKWFGFALHSGKIDYRTDEHVSITAVQPSLELVRQLGKLMDLIGLDFGAADFKKCPETGEMLFLEVNSAPMFSSFDNIARGALSTAIIDDLVPVPARQNSAQTDKTKDVRQPAATAA